MNPNAGTLCALEYGKTSENIYAGMDEEYRRYQPAIITWYETAKQPLLGTVNWQNIGGIENE